MADSLSPGSLQPNAALLSPRSCGRVGFPPQRYRLAMTFLHCLASEGIEAGCATDTCLSHWSEPLERPGEHFRLIAEMGITPAWPPMGADSGLHPQQASRRPGRIALAKG